MILIPGAGIRPGSQVTASRPVWWVEHPGRPRGHL